jgi:alanyl-tRNA synthetase
MKGVVHNIVGGSSRQSRRSTRHPKENQIGNSAHRHQNPWSLLSIRPLRWSHPFRGPRPPNSQGFYLTSSNTHIQNRDPNSSASRRTLTNKGGLTISIPKQTPPTQLLYYEDAYLKEFDARILKMMKIDDRYGIILDRTAFYPTGGGQPADTGVIKGKNREIRIEDVQMINGAVVHLASEIRGEIKEGTEVRDAIDWDRRYALMRNHTAAHLVAEAVRRAADTPMPIIGSAIDVDKARLDFAHKENLRPLLPEIERIANDVVKEDRVVVVKMMKREEAEKYVEKFHESLKILPPQVQEVRIVEIKDWHACACGGTHLKSTGEIGTIKVLKRVSKGKRVERIEFSAKES